MKKTMVVTIMAAAMALGMGLSVNAAPNADDMEFTVCELEESVETAAEEATADITIADASDEDSMDDMEFEVVGEEETVVSSVEDAAADIVSTEVETVEESSQPARPTQDFVPEQNPTPVYAEPESEVQAPVQVSESSEAEIADDEVLVGGEIIEYVLQDTGENIPVVLLVSVAIAAVLLVGYRKVH